MKKYGIRYTGLMAMATAASLWLAPISAQTGTQTTTPQTPQRPTMTSTAPVEVTLAVIRTDATKHYNKNVTVTAQVDEVLGAQTFTLDDEVAGAAGAAAAAATAGAADILVITPALTTPVPDGETVTVVGTLRPFVEADLKRDFDWDWWNDWKVELTTTYKDKPVLLATSIKTKDGKELVKK